MISSPAFHVRPSARLSANHRLVLFCPKTISSGRAALRKRAVSARAAATATSVRWLVTNDPPVLALSRLR